MTPTELRELLTKLEQPTPYEHVAIAPDRLAEIVRDALRFAHVRETVELGRMGGSSAVLAGFKGKIDSGRPVSVQDIRDAWTAAIDADMENTL